MSRIQNRELFVEKSERIFRDYNNHLFEFIREGDLIFCKYPFESGIKDKRFDMLYALKKEFIYNDDTNGHLRDYFNRMIGNGIIEFNKKYDIDDDNFLALCDRFKNRVEAKIDEEMINALDQENEKIDIHSKIRRYFMNDSIINGRYYFRKIRDDLFVNQSGNVKIN